MPIIYLETEATNAAGSYIFENLMNVQLFLASLNIYNKKWYNFTRALDRLIYELEVALLHQRVRIYFILWKFPRKILLFNIYICKFWWLVWWKINSLDTCLALKFVISLQYFAVVKTQASYAAYIQLYIYVVSIFIDAVTARYYFVHKQRNKY